MEFGLEELYFLKRVGAVSDYSLITLLSVMEIRNPGTWLLSIDSSDVAIGLALAHHGWLTVGTAGVVVSIARMAVSLGVEMDTDAFLDLVQDLGRTHEVAGNQSGGIPDDVAVGAAFRRLGLLPGQERRRTEEGRNLPFRNPTDLQRIRHVFRSVANPSDPSLQNSIPVDDDRGLLNNSFLENIKKVTALLDELRTVAANSASGQTPSATNPVRPIPRRPEDAQPPMTVADLYNSVVYNPAPGIPASVADIPRPPAPESRVLQFFRPGGDLPTSPPNHERPQLSVQPFFNKIVERMRSHNSPYHYNYMREMMILKEVFEEHRGRDRMYQGIIDEVLVMNGVINREPMEIAEAYMRVRALLDLHELPIFQAMRTSEASNPTPNVPPVSPEINVTSGSPSPILIVDDDADTTLTQETVQQRSIPTIVISDSSSPVVIENDEVENTRTQATVQRGSRPTDISFESAMRAPTSDQRARVGGASRGSTSNRGSRAAARARGVAVNRRGARGSRGMTRGTDPSRHCQETLQVPQRELSSSGTSQASSVSPTSSSGGVQTSRPQDTLQLPKPTPVPFSIFMAGSNQTELSIQTARELRGRDNRSTASTSGSQSVTDTSEYSPSQTQQSTAGRDRQGAGIETQTSLSPRTCPSTASSAANCLSPSINRDEFNTFLNRFSPGSLSYINNHYVSAFQGRHASAIASQPRATGPRSSGPRTSWPRYSEPRTSHSRPSEPRASASRVSQPRASQPRPSEPRTSQSRASEPRSSEPRGSGPRASWPRNSEPRTLQPRASQPRVSEPRSETSEAGNLTVGTSEAQSASGSNTSAASPADSYSPTTSYTGPNVRERNFRINMFMLSVLQSHINLRQRPPQGENAGESVGGGGMTSGDGTTSGGQNPASSVPLERPVNLGAGRTSGTGTAEDPIQIEDDAPDATVDPSRRSDRPEATTSQQGSSEAGTSAAGTSRRSGEQPHVPSFRVPKRKRDPSDQNPAAKRGRRF